MKSRAIFHTLPVCLLALGLAHAKPVRNGAVEAELVPAVTSVQPGQAFDVAVRLAHDAHWHSYWINPGTGLPTTVKWMLPAGWQAGNIQWPVPHVLIDAGGTITGNGYDGEVFLFITLTPPATLQPGESVTLKAAVEWLMCQEVCMPGEAALELTLPVDGGPPAPHPRWGAKLAAAQGKLPHAPDGWQLAATRAAKSVTLTARPPAGTTFAPGDFHFFSDDGLIAYDKPQPVSEQAGAFVFTLPVDDAGPKDAGRLSGVLALSKGDVPGIRVDVPFGAAAATPGSVPPAAGTAASNGLGGTLLLAFLGGLILNLMPCVFPVLGIKILGFVNQAGADRRKVTLHGLVFSLGVLLSFWVLAGGLLALRAGGKELGWGFQLQEPGFVFALAAFLLIFALNLSGLFEIGLSVTGTGASLQMQHGYAGSFFTGGLATVVATPCSAPFLAPALGAAFSQTFSAGESFLLFTAIAVGLALPYLLLSLFPQAVKLLPRPGAWMETFKQLMAFPLYATVGWLLWVLAGQTKDDDFALLLIVFGLVLVAMAAWAYGRWTQHGGSAGWRRFGYAFAAVLLVAGVAIGFPGQPSKDIVWQPWSPETVARLRAEGKMLYVDFTARWCATCQSNKAVVFSSQAVRDALRRQGVVLLKADWTSRDPQITEALASFNRSAVPMDLIYAPGRAEPILLPELLTPEIVSHALLQAAKKDQMEKIN
jgi:thiol:disulfide interchange protein DsbD